MFVPHRAVNPAAAIAGLTRPAASRFAVSRRAFKAVQGDLPMVTPLDGPRRKPASGGTATALVVLLHGLGADGADLIELAGPLARALPNAAFAAPNAPDPCDMA